MADSRLQYIFDLIMGKNEVSDAMKKTDNTVKNTTKSVKENNKETKSLNNTFKSLIPSVSSLTTIFAGLSGAFVVKRIISEATLLENSLIGLKAVATATGQSAEYLSDQAKELAADGIIPLSEVSRSLKNLLASGLDADKSIEVFKALRDAAAFNRQGQLDMGEAVARATDGIKNQLSILVDNAGITKNLSIIVKEYASSVGKAVVDLSEYEKQQAIANGIIKEARIFQGDYNRSLQTFTGVTSAASGNFRFLLADLGEYVTKNPLVIKAISNFTVKLKDFRKIVNEGKNSFIGFIRDGIEFGIEAIDTLNKNLRAIQGFLTGVFIVGITAATSAVVSFGTAMVAAITTIATSIATATISTTALVGALSTIATGGAIIAIIGLATAIGKVADEMGGLDGLVLKVQNNLGILGRLIEIEFTKLQLSGAQAINKIGNSIKSLLGIDTGFKPIEFDTSEAVVEINKLNDEIDVLQKGIDDKRKENTQKGFGDFGKSLTKNLKNARKLLDVFDKERKKKDKERDKEQEEEEAKRLAAFKKSYNLESTIGALAKGAEGARNLIVSGASRAIDLFAPGVGKAVQPLLDAFSKGPAETRKMVKEFARGITDTISNLIESAPVFVEAIINELPALIDRLLSAVPRLIKSLLESIPTIVNAIIAAIPGIVNAIINNIGPIFTAIVQNLPQIFKGLIKGIPQILSALYIEFPKLALNLVTSLIAELPTLFSELIKNFPNMIIQMAKSFPTLFTELAKNFPRMFTDMAKNFPGFIKEFLKLFLSLFNPGNLLKKIFKFDGGGKGPIEKLLGFDFPFLKFSRGGRVPGQASVFGDSELNDTVPALLSPGEYVLTRSQVRDLKKAGIPGFGLGGFISGLISGAGQLVGGIGSAVSGVLSGDFSGAADRLQASFYSALNEVADEFPLIPKEFKEIIASLKTLNAKIPKVSDLITDPVKAVSDVVVGPLFGMKDIVKKLLVNPFSGQRPLATGGLIPPGFNNDSFPARLSSGELVVSRAETERLSNFISTQNNNDVMLAKILDLLSKPIQVNSSVEVNNKAFANIILELNRTNQRISI